MKIVLLGAGALLASHWASAQVIASTDSSLLASTVAAAHQRYLATGLEARLVNGVAYANKPPSYVTGRPFFQSSDPQLGTIDYEGQQYVGVPLLYEQVLDQVLLYGPSQAMPIQLVRQHVQAFELAGHRFVRLPADSSGVLVEGFYDLVVEGPARLLVKRAKKLEAATGGYTLKGEYEEVTRFYVQRQAHFYEVTTPKQLLALLEEYNGLQGQREFFAPRYDAPAPSSLPDQRNLLHWQPAIYLAPGAAQELTFYTSDQVGRYRVVVQGLAADGLAGSANVVFDVKPTL